MYSSSLYDLWVQRRIRYVIQGSAHYEARAGIFPGLTIHSYMHDTDFGNW